MSKNLIMFSTVFSAIVFSFGAAANDFSGTTWKLENTGYHNETTITLEIGSIAEDGTFSGSLTWSGMRNPRAALQAIDPETGRTLTVPDRDCLDGKYSVQGTTSGELVSWTMEPNNQCRFIKVWIGEHQTTFSGSRRIETRFLEGDMESKFQQSGSVDYWTGPTTN